jgi:hypothetical protein
MRYALYTTVILAAVILLAAPFAAADERSYRTVGKKQYEILDTSYLYIYSTNVIVRKAAVEKAYFFSKGATGELLPLTITNLKKAFPANHNFHDSLDMMFRSDSGLTRWDEFHNMFKVNRLLIASEPGS